MELRLAIHRTLGAPVDNLSEDEIDIVQDLIRQKAECELRLRRIDAQLKAMVPGYEG